MRSLLLCGARFLQAPPVGYFYVFSLRIKEPLRNEAISLSVALKRPERSFGAITDSSIFSFTRNGQLSRYSPLCIALKRIFQVTGRPDHLEVVGFVKGVWKIVRIWWPSFKWISGKSYIIIMRSTYSRNTILIHWKKTLFYFYKIRFSA